MANAADWFIDRHLREARGGECAVIDPWRRLTYGELAAATARMAGGLRAAGVDRERRLAMLMLDTVDFPTVFWGAIRAGVLPVPINTLLPPEQVAFILQDSRAEAAVVSAPLFPALRPILEGAGVRLLLVAAPDGGPTTATPGADLAAFLGTGPAAFAPVAASEDEVAFWLYSSGSTGAPKGVRHVHASLRATADTYGAQVLGIRADDVIFSAAKLFFAYGLGNGMTFPMAAGATAVLLPDRPTPDAVLATMRAYAPTIFAGVPTLYAGLLAHPELGAGAGSPGLRRCISAGEALPEPIARRWQEVVGTEILDGIGSTEMLHIFLSNRPGEVRHGATGVAVPGYQLRIVDEDGTDLADGEVGELLVCGPSAADGYWNQRDKTRRTFRGEWTATGDKYLRDADGSYRFQGRADDMFKVSGIWVSPFEVEAALMAHPAVQEAAVVGREDADGLTKPMAHVVLRPGQPDLATLTPALQAWVKDRAGPWKYPRWIAAVPELPKTATGKIQRFKLRAGVP